MSTVCADEGDESVALDSTLLAVALSILTDAAAAAAVDAAAAAAVDAGAVDAGAVDAAARGADGGYSRARSLKKPFKYCLLSTPSITTS